VKSTPQITKKVEHFQELTDKEKKPFSRSLVRGQKLFDSLEVLKAKQGNWGVLPRNDRAA
jgi:alanyl-tRNA synthetase